MQILDSEWDLGGSIEALPSICDRNDRLEEKMVQSSPRSPRWPRNDLEGKPAATRSIANDNQMLVAPNLKLAPIHLIL
jgi:hypothetical protein